MTRATFRSVLSLLSLADAQSGAVEQRAVKELSLIDNRLSWNGSAQSTGYGLPFLCDVAARS